jgi:Reverse transcriptase (RNA-dependent DNA polymerase)
MFEPDENEGDHEVIIKLNRSLHGLVQAPYLWFNHCSDALGKVGLEPSQLDTCLFYGRGVVAVLYVDIILLWGKDGTELDRIIQELRDQYLSLTEEKDNDSFAFLGVTMKDNEDGSDTLTQEGLIRKILEVTKMADCEAKLTPATTTPLCSDPNGTCGCFFSYHPVCSFYALSQGITCRCSDSVDTSKEHQRRDSSSPQPRILPSTATAMVISQTCMALAKLKYCVPNKKNIVRAFHRNAHNPKFLKRSPRRIYSSASLQC